MDKTINAFTQTIQTAKSQGYHVTAIAYFAGHGLVWENKNYLIPIGAEYIPECANIEYDAYSQKKLDNALNSAHLKILLIDACRNAPQQNNASCYASRDIPIVGIKKEEPTTPQKNNNISLPQGAYTLHATQEGKKAEDGKGNNSPFMEAILETLNDNPEDEGHTFFDKVIEKVENKTKNIQSPAPAGRIPRNFYFRTPKSKEATPKIEVPKELITQPKPDLPNIVTIKGGTFLMGSPANEPERYPNETQHTVTLSGFKMTKYEITNQEYADFLNVYGSDEVKSGQYKGEKMIYEGSWGVKKQNNKWQPVEGYAKHPVVNVTWFGANEYARYQGGRLPTEAEWEYACRAGTTTPFNTGSNLTTAQGNYDGKYPYNNNPKGEYREKTLPVGSFEPNAWGLYDMHGNVSEWCEDWYDSNFYTTAEAKKTNPLNIKQGGLRSLRGGSWNNSGRNCRSANRINCIQSLYNYYYGFRVVFEL